MITIINWIFGLFSLLILARVLLSWVPLDYYHPVRRTIYNLTEPFLEPLRRIIPPMGGFDLTPIALLLLAQLAQRLLISLLV